MDKEIDKLLALRTGQLSSICICVLYLTMYANNNRRRKCVYMNA